MAQRRDASGQWVGYYIGADNEYRAAPFMAAILPRPVEVDPDEDVPPARYSITLGIRATYTNSKGVQYSHTHTLNSIQDVPSGWTLPDLLQSVVEDWIEERFRSNSPPEVDILSHQVDEVDVDADLNSMPMGGGSRNLRSFFIATTAAEVTGERIRYARNMDIEHHVDGTQCVVDYLLWEAAKVDSRKGHWTRAWLKEQLGMYPTVDRIVSFAKKERDVCVYAVDCMMKLFRQHTSEARPRVWLVFMVKERHCLPITNAKWRACITRNGGVTMEDLTLTRWSFDEATYIEAADEATTLAAVAAPPVSGKDKVRVLALDDLDLVAASVTAATGCAIDKMLWVRAHIAAFEHPTTNVVFVAGRDFPERRALCDKFFALYRVDDFRFANQSWGAIAHAALQTKFAAFPPSHYSTEYLHILEKYPVGPYRACLVDEREPAATDQSLDIRRCYSAILRNAAMEWPVFGPLDYVVELPGGIGPRGAAAIEAGEYYVANGIRMGGGTIVLSRGWYPSCLVRYALANGYISPADVTFVLRASTRVPADVFTSFCDYIEEEHTEHSKDLLNTLIGCFGSQASLTTRSGTTTDLETAVATLAAIQVRGNQGSMFIYNGVAILQETTRTQKTQGQVPLFRAVLAGSYAMLDEMHRALCTPFTRVLAYNTDSMKVRGPVNEAAIRSKESCEWGEWHAEFKVVLSGRPLQELPWRAEYTLDRAPPTVVDEAHGDAFRDRLFSGSGLVMGPPGCGKTYLLAELYNSVAHKDTIIVTAYTHAASQNLRDKGLPARVFSSLVFNPKTQKMDPTLLEGCQRLLLDEYTMLPPPEMRVLLQAHALYGFQVWAAGDFRQCTAPVDNPIDYHTHPLFLHMCGNFVVKLQYKVGTGRYDDSLHAAIANFQQTGKLTAWRDHAPPTTPCFTNICFTNVRRHQLNAECYARWLDTRTHEPEVNVGTDKTPFWVCPGLPVMAYHGHIHELDILKTQVWTVDKADPVADFVALSMAGRDSVCVTLKQFRAVFDYAFAMTVQKCQGLTVPEYAIHELNHPRMTFNTVYTAISRGVTLSKVYLHDVSHWDRVYTAQDTGRTLLLDAKQLTPRLVPAVVFRVTAVAGEASYIGVATGADADTFSDTIALRLATQAMPDGMSALLPATTTVDVLERVFLRDASKAAGLEEVWVQRELDMRGRALNAPATGADDIDAVSDTSSVSSGGVSTASSRSRKRKFEPVHYPDLRCFLVRCRSRGIATHHRTRKFTYDADDDADAAEAAAEAWASDMRDIYQ